MKNEETNSFSDAQKSFTFEKDKTEQNEIEDSGT
jgi:hypothetical protein